MEKLSGRRGERQSASGQNKREWRTSNEVKGQGLGLERGNCTKALSRGSVQTSSLVSVPAVLTFPLSLF